MARYGINTNGTLGVPVPVIRALAKAAGRDHALALELWDSGVHEARILATIVDDPARVTKARWSAGPAISIPGTSATRPARISSATLRTPGTWPRSGPRARPEFVRRAGFP